MLSHQERREPNNERNTSKIVMSRSSKQEHATKQRWAYEREMYQPEPEKNGLLKGHES